MANWFIDEGACPVFAINGVRTSVLSALGHLFREILLREDIQELFFDHDNPRNVPATAKDWLRKLDDSRLVPSLLDRARANVEDCCLCFCSEDDYTHISDLMRSFGPDENLDFPTKVNFMAQGIGLLHAPVEILWKYWQAFFRAETFERLGLAHACHYWEYRTVHDLCDENERSELRDEDIKAGFFADLESWMEKYDAMEKSFIQGGGSLDSFVAAWTYKLNQELFENETHRGLSVEVSVDFNPAAYILGLKALSLDQFPWEDFI
jgi:hypothetical protein